MHSESVIPSDDCFAVTYMYVTWRQLKNVYRNCFKLTTIYHIFFDKVTTKNYYGNQIKEVRWEGRVVRMRI